MGKIRNNNWSDEKRQKQAEICRQTGLANRGRRLSEEHKQKIGDALRRKFVTRVEWKQEQDDF